MSHLALYRKYRPQTFNEVRGQDQAVSYLESIVSSGRVPHALLLTGSRGIGKTTLARIYGKSLGIDAHDIYEIDAASNNGVDNIRELREEVNTLPMNSSYKMYILDEVHMFSSSAFNAFLKILEEPPRHVIFVLATTELHKVLPTVISRCQVVHLKKPTTAILVNQIIDVAKQERKTISPEHALPIAQRANGSFRDALVLLDQVLEQSTGKEITGDDIARLGLRSFDHLAFDFVSALVARDSDKLFAISKEVSGNDGKTLIEFLEKLLSVLRSVLYVKYAPGLWKQVQESLADDQIAMIADWSTQGVITDTHLTKFLSAYEEVKRSNIPAIPLELAIIDILK